jgi:hypothetical protein
MANILRLLLFILLSLPGMKTHAQNSAMRLIHSSPDFHVTDVQFHLGEYEFVQVETSDGLAQIILLNASSPMLIKGAPDLPQMTASIQIPNNLEMEIEVISDNYIDIPNISIAASLGNFYRNEPLQNTDRKYSENFNHSLFFPNNIVRLSEPYIYKNVRGQTLIFNPFQYNFETRVLRVHQQIQLRIKSNNRSSIRNCLPPNLIKSNTKNDEELLKHHFINYSVSRSTEANDNERLLIVTTELFKPELTSFISWKRKCGFELEVQTIEQIGNADQLKQFILTRYLNQPFSNLILIGDDGQIPSLLRFGGASDPSFGYVLGDDYYPEISVGRISAETIPELITQLNRILAYDKAEGMNHFNRFTGIASELGPGDNNEFDYQHIRGIGNQLAQSGYAHVDELFDGSQGGADLNGNPNAAELVNTFNSGTGLVMYAGHGVQSKFTTTDFGIDDVNSLNNINQLPFVVSVACLNGDFIQGTCLAESFMRSENNAQAVGAVGAYMSSINQSWNPPMSAQDEIANIISGYSTEITDYSIGNICELACVKMIDDYGNAGAEMAATWHLFGDPTLNLRTKTSQNIEATFLNSIPINTNEIIIYCPVDNALIAISQNDILIGTAIVEGGIALIEFSQLSSLDSISVVITAQNYFPFEGFIHIEPSELPYIALDSIVINDALGNSNAQIDFNEHIYLDIHFSNLGLLNSNEINLSVTSENSDIELINSDCYFDALNALSSTQSSTCVELLIPENIQDQSIFHFNIQFSDDQGNDWNYTYSENVNAPVLQFQASQLLELEGNFNGRADPSELVQLSIPVINTGHSSSLPAELSVSTTSNFIEIHDNLIQLNYVEPNEVINANVEISINPNAVKGSSIPIHLQYVSSGIVLETTILLKIGAIIEDAESHDFAQFNWDTSHVNSWKIDESIAHSGNASFRSYQIMNAESSELSIQISANSNDSIRFYYKVSSEFQWDVFQFYIDDELMLNKSGEVDWTFASLPITAGNHHLQWIYSKDEFVSSGFDAAWIDDIEFPAGTIATLIRPDETQQQFKIYPNPAKRIITIEGQVDFLNTIISIADLQGRIVYSCSNGCYSGNKFELELPESLHTGIYFIRIGKAVHRLVILN